MFFYYVCFEIFLHTRHFYVRRYFSIFLIISMFIRRYEGDWLDGIKEGTGEILQKIFNTKLFILGKFTYANGDVFTVS